MCRFSVVIPVYNKERVVKETVNSVLLQDYAGIELILVDDGSTDGSLEILEGLEAPRVRVFSITNSGPSVARNYGIKQARGEWTVVLDADDILLPGALNAFDRAIERWPSAQMITANFYDVRGKEQVPHLNRSFCGIVRNPFRAWFFKKIMPCAGAFACKTAVLQAFPYDKKLRRSEDTELMFRLFPHVVVAGIADCTMSYRHDYSSESKKVPPMEMDFKGHISFDKNKSLWEKICLYECFVEAKNVYPQETRELYPDVYNRLSLKLAYHAAFWTRYLSRI